MVTTDPTWTQSSLAGPVSVTRKVPERHRTAITLWVFEGLREGLTITFGGFDEHADRQPPVRISANVSHRPDIECDATGHGTMKLCRPLRLPLITGSAAPIDLGRLPSVNCHSPAHRDRRPVALRTDGDGSTPCGRRCVGRDSERGAKSTHPGTKRHHHCATTVVRQRNRANFPHD